MSGRRTIIRNDITTGGIASHGGVITGHPKTLVNSSSKRSSKERIKSSTVAIYASVFALIISVVAAGYRAPEESVATNSIVAQTSGMSNPTADDVLATRIAADVASVSDLAVAGNISELAVSTKVEHDYAIAKSSDSVAKPTIVELSAASRNITTYTVVDGDSVPTVAAKFGISAQTLRWSNNLVGDTLTVGKVLDILPRDGIVYTVKDGDSIDKLAERYGANALTITTYNDLETSGLTPGLKIVIPGGELPNNERPGYVAPVVYSSFVSGYGTWSGQVLRMWSQGTPNTGGYAPGNCTAYAYLKRAQMGRPIPTNLGNAYTWATVASRTPGYVVNGTPAAGAVIQAGNHVGIVEEVLANGDLRITDMNYGYRLYNVAERIIPARSVGNYRYIH